MRARTETRALLHAAETLGARQVKVGPDVGAVDGVVAPDRRSTPTVALWHDRSADLAELSHRVHCGSGTFDVQGFVATLQQIGFTGRWGVEIISDDHRQRPLDDALVDTYRTTMAIFGAPER